MEFWLQCVNTLPEDIVGLAVLAEECDFAGIMEGDHWVVPARSEDTDTHERGQCPGTTRSPTSSSLRGRCSRRPPGFGLHPSALVLANRTNPLIVANSCATASRIGAGRFALGVVLGWMEEEFDVAGVDLSTRAPRTAHNGDDRDSPKTVGHGPIEHHGSFSDFPPTHNIPRPDGDIAIYIGACVPASLRRAGRIGDGWMAPPETAEELAAAIHHH